MTRLKRLLLAFDFNKSTASAINKAKYLAQKFDGEIIPVHAVEHIPYHHGLNYWHVIHDEIKPGMEEVCDKLARSGVRVHAPVIQEGRPYDIILSCAEQFNVDIIIVGGGKPSLAETLLGTSAVKIVRNAKRMVCTVPPSEKIPEIERILCPVDLSLASNEVLTIAVDLAVVLNAELTVLHVVPKAKRYPGLETCELPVVDMEIGSDNGPTQSLATIEDLDQRLQKNMSVTFDEHLSKAIGDKVKYRRLLRRGQPDDQIVKAVKDEACDLLIMGTVSPRNLSGILVGNIAEKVMRRIPCSLLTVKHRGVASLSRGGRSKTAKARAATAEMDSGFHELSSFLEERYENGRRLLAERSYQQAIAEFVKCTERDKHFYAAYDALADCYKALGDLAKVSEFEEIAKTQRRYLWELQYAHGDVTQ